MQWYDLEYEREDVGHVVPPSAEVGYYYDQQRPPDPHNPDGYLHAGDSRQTPDGQSCFFIDMSSHLMLYVDSKQVFSISCRTEGSLKR